MHVEKACSIGSRSSTPRNHLNDFRLLLWSELRTAAADASLPASAFQTHLGTFAKHSALELSKRTEHLQHHAPGRACGIDRLLSDSANLDAVVARTRGDETVREAGSVFIPTLLTTTISH
jgi:hypothetical protein